MNEIVSPEYKEAEQVPAMESEAIEVKENAELLEEIQELKVLIKALTKALAEKEED